MLFTARHCNDERKGGRKVLSNFSYIMTETAKWYVIHTYSGYEKKVETNIAKMIENRGMHEQILEIRVPEEDDTDSTGKKVVKRKIFPGYVFLKMIMSDECWHAIRSIRGVTGFVGPESKPVPLTDAELETMKLEKRVYESDYAVDDVVRITDGPLSGYIGKVLEISPEKGKLKLSVDLFMGRETVIDLDMNQVETLD